MSHNPATGDPSVARTPRRNRRTLNLTAALGQRLKTALRHWQRHRMIRTLQGLNDWTLDDIGLTRNEIRRFAGDFVAQAPGPVSSARMVRSPRRGNGPEDLSLARINGSFPINDTKETKQNWDVHQSWRDL